MKELAQLWELMNRQEKVVHMGNIVRQEVMFALAFLNDFPHPTMSLRDVVEYEAKNPDWSKQLNKMEELFNQLDELLNSKGFVLGTEERKKIAEYPPDGVPY